MQLATINELKMTSREIAELTGKRHNNVKRDITSMLDDLDLGVLKFEHTYLDVQNKTQVEYKLDHDLTLTLITGYSAVLRHKVIKRWRELEEKVAKLEEMNHRLANEDELGRLRQEVARERAARFRAEDMFYFEHNALMRIEDKKSFQEQTAAAIDSARQAWSARCDMREENIGLQESLMTLRERHRIALEYVGSDVSLLNK